MFKTNTILCMFLVGVSCNLCAKTLYDVSYKYNGFFNYNHVQKRVTFMETVLSIHPKTNDLTVLNTVYTVDLNEKKVVEKVDSAAFSGCIHDSPKLDSNGVWLASVDHNNKVLFLREQLSGKCFKKRYIFDIDSFDWTRDGNWLVVSERDRKSFHLFDIKTKVFKSYSHNGTTQFFVWDAQLKTTLFAFLPEKYAPGKYKVVTSDMYEYFFVDKKGDWVQYKHTPALYNDKYKIHYVLTRESELNPYTTFYDSISNKKLKVVQHYFLRSSQSYVLMLAGGIVYFHGGHGLFDSKRNEFISFSSDDDWVIPFAVDKDRYAIMFDNKQSLLKVYDLETRKYIESYPPFWR